MHKTLDLNRFKKSLQGLIDFAVLLEQAEPAQRENLIQLARKQDAEFLHRVMRKAVFFEELVFMDESILAEILSNITPKILAFAISGMPEDFCKLIHTTVGYRVMKAILDEQDKFSAEPNAQLVMGARKQILKIARTLEAQNRFVFELNECPRFKSKRKSAAP